MEELLMRAIRPAQQDRSTWQLNSVKHSKMWTGSRANGLRNRRAENGVLCANVGAHIKISSVDTATGKWLTSHYLWQPENIPYHAYMQPCVTRLDYTHYSYDGELWTYELETSLNRWQLGKNGKLNNKVTKRPTPSLNPDETALRSKGLNIVDYDLFSVEVK